MTFKQAVEAFVIAKANEGRSASYLRDLRYCLPRFGGLHDRLLADIALPEIESEMQGITPSVRNAFLRILRTCWNYSIKRGWAETNPVATPDFIRFTKSEATVLSHSMAHALMASAMTNGLVPYHALGLFAGIRPMEIERITWDAINLSDGNIVVPASVSKAGTRRIVPIEPNLKAWLDQCIATDSTELGFVVQGGNLRARLRECRVAAGMEHWVQDVMRHSYASYWLAHWGTSGASPWLLDIAAPRQCFGNTTMQLLVKQPPRVFGRSSPSILRTPARRSLLLHVGTDLAQNQPANSSNL